MKIIHISSICSVLILSIGLCGCGHSSAAEEATSESEAYETEAYETAVDETDAVEASEAGSDFTVEAIPAMSEDFICGVDVSSVLVEEKSGVRYYNEDGIEQDIFQTLAESGVNTVRLRVWNDPYDAEGHGYGGGNNDVETAILLGKRATEYGLKVCVDFHYSDFWADPKRQLVPKAWEGMDLDEKSTELYDFTVESLTRLLEEGVDISMVQIGNEINNAMCGESTRPNIYRLLDAGSRAVREVAETQEHSMSIMVHYTDINDTNNVLNLVTGLTNSGVDYDVIGLSYYPYWHGDLENLGYVLAETAAITGKQVVIAETAYAYTSQDGDGFANSYYGGNDAVSGYPISVQGQADLIRDVCAAAVTNEAIGVFYWEPAWIPVGSASEDLSSVWEEYGSGWASSYAAEYDPEDAGVYYGGCSWDNQTLFDRDGYPLQSLSVWKYLKSGYPEE